MPWLPVAVHRHLVQMVDEWICHLVLMYPDVVFWWSFFFRSSWIKAGIITFSRAVNSGNKWCDWNTKPIFEFPEQSKFLWRKSGYIYTITFTWPESGLSRVPRIWRSVLFPAPEAPTIEIISPVSIVRSIPLKPVGCQKISDSIGMNHTIQMKRWRK